MSKITTDGMDRLMEHIRAVETRVTGHELGEVLEAGADEYIKAWRQVIGERHTRTGQMRDAVNKTEPHRSAKDGLTVEVYPMGQDDKGAYNATKAFVANYGKSRKMSAATRRRRKRHPYTRKSGDKFVNIAEDMARDKATEAMQRALDEIINKEG